MAVTARERVVVVSAPQAVITFAAIAFAVGGTAMTEAGGGWDDNLAAGHPAISEYNSKQDLETVGFVGLGVGAGLSALAGTILGLNWVTTSEVQATDSLYGIRPQDCQDEDEHLLGMIPNTADILLNEQISLKATAKGVLSSEKEDIPAQWVNALLDESASIDISMEVRAEGVKAQDSLEGSQRVTLEQGRDAPALDALARLAQLVEQPVLAR